MTLFHAVVWIDHNHAQVLQFDADHVETRKLKAHSHHTKLRGNAVRTEHEFFGDLCDAIADIPEVLVTGSHSTLADLRHYVDKHRPQVAPRLVGWEAVDHPSDNQLVALARKFFVAYDRMAGVPTPK